MKYFYQRWENGRCIDLNAPKITTEESVKQFKPRKNGLKVLLINPPIREWSYPNIIPIGHAYIASVAIMDGHYVPNITVGPNIVKSLRLITNKILDVHLMIKNVNDHIESFISAGSDIVSFHPEAVSNPEKIINKIKNFGKKCGIAIHPEVEIKEIEKYVALVDMIIVMTVVPGFGGQKFLQNQIPKISKFRKNLVFQMVFEKKKPTFLKRFLKIFSKNVYSKKFQNNISP